MMKPLGAILAGGRSSRFGSDKALAALRDEPLVAHVARALDEFVAETILCGRGEPVAGLVAIADWPRPDLGPLGGLCGALRYAAARGHCAVISIGCDMPVLPATLIERLIAWDGAAYVGEAPVLGYWPAALARVLENYLLADGDRSIRRWAASIGAETIEAGGRIPNLNRPEDLTRLQASLHRY